MYPQEKLIQEKYDYFNLAVKKETLDINSIFDPCMPTVEIECPECGYDSAIYFLIPD